MGFSNKFKLNYFNRLILTINTIFLLVAYCVYLNMVFSPKEIPYLNFLSIGFPIIYIINLLFLVYWLLFSWRHFVLMFILSSGLIYPIYLSYPLINFNKKKEIKSDFSVLTYNVHGFRDEGTKEFLVENKADIMILQEAREKQQKSLKANEFKDYYVEFYDLLTIYSKYPIIQTKEIFTKENDLNGAAAYVDIDLGNDTIRIINVYLEPMYIDKDLVKDIIKSDNQQQVEENSKKVELKLVKGMQAHVAQLEAIKPFIKASKHPVIIGSDLNSTPLSYEYNQLNKLLTDSYINSGKSGVATTFHGFKFPIRIDYLFNSENLIPVNSSIIRKRFSDHYPVLINYKLVK